MRHLLVFSLTMFLSYGISQSNQDIYKHDIKQTDIDINIDGDLSESIWNELEPFGDFWYSFPVDDKKVEDEFQTEVRIAYDEKYIYIGAICYGPGPFVIPSLKRDNNKFWDGEVFSVVFDAVNERTNGASFGTNPAGTQFDTQIGANTGTRGGFSGGSGGFNVAWDNKWLVDAKEFPDKWTCEMAIPFKSLKYGDKTNWGINFVRGVASTNSWHTWAPVPVQLTGVDLGFTGTLEWDQAPPKAKGNISIIPYVLTSIDKDFEEDSKTNTNLQAGLDAKIAINSNLNLDLTINPDFSQVDVDEQVTNLTTVNIRFPERRLFFLENGDVFNEFGIPPMRPFFSRKIGLDDDGNTIPILYGARLSGNLNKDLRVGLMNLQTKDTEEFVGQNYTSIAFNQRLFGRTILKGYLHNRQAFDDGEFSKSDYNRAVGGEIDFRSQNGNWRGNVGYGASLTDGVKTDNKTYHLIVAHNSRNVSFYSNYMVVGDNYIPDMGFMSDQLHYDAIIDTSYRLGYGHTFTTFSYIVYPEGVAINNHRIGFRYNSDFATTSKNLFNSNITGSYQINFANTSMIEVEMKNSTSRLLFPFDFTGEEPLPEGRYNWSSFEFTYTTDQRKSLALEAGFVVGGFYNGKRQELSAEVNYRHQPWGNFGLRFVQNELTFPDPYGSESLTLIGPKAEINFTRNLYWTTFLQYNTQRDNFNINSRFQWQFQPLSNIYLVYSDNYAIEHWGPKNRAVVLKLNYWLNL